MKGIIRNRARRLRKRKITTVRRKMSSHHPFRLNRARTDVRIGTVVPRELHNWLRSITGVSGPYRSIGSFLLQLSLKAMRESQKRPGSKDNIHASAEDAPRTEMEWQWTYALIRFLRASRLPGLKQHLAEMWGIKK